MKRSYGQVFGNYQNSKRMRKTRRLLQGPLYSTSNRFIGPRPRAGFSSVARTRGAAVTGEMKYFDCDKSNTAIALATTTWVAGTMFDPTTTLNLGSAAVATPLCLFAPTVGSGLNQRVGRAVRMMKVKVNGYLSTDPQVAQTTADAGTMVRILLVLDKQTNAGQMTGAQLMRDGSVAATTANSFQNPDNFGRFRVLKEKVYAISDPNTSGSPTAGDVIAGALCRRVKFSCRLKGLPVNFNATNGGTVADIVNHSLHIVAITNNQALSPSLSYYSRVSFKE